MTDDQHQKIQVPIADEASFLSEGAWAKHLGDDRYQIDNLLGFTEGVSAGDIVRVEVLPDGQLVAVEVLERWPGPTFVFSPDTDEVGARFAWDVIGDVLDRSPAAARFDREGLMKGSVAVRYAAEDEAWFWRELVNEVSSRQGATIVADHDAQRVGPLSYWLVTHHSWDVPQPLDPTRLRAKATAPELVAVDWPASNDEIVQGWPNEFVEYLRATAMSDARIRESLEERRYLQVVLWDLRGWAVHEFGLDRVGQQPWPLFGDGTKGGRSLWDESRSPDGHVRYAPDDEVNQRMREAMSRFGLNPDADPFQPVA